MRRRVGPELLHRDQGISLNGQLPGERVTGLGHLEGAAASQHLIQDDADGPDVRLAVGVLLGVEVFRRHVGVGAGPARDRVRPQDFGQAEVHQLYHALAGQQDIGGLDVAVNGAMGVGVGQPVTDLSGNVERLGDGELRGLAENVLEVAPTDVLHVNDDLAADLVHAVDLDDIRVAQAVQHAGFFQDTVLFFALGGDLFEGDLFAQQGVFGEVDDSGRAVSQHVQPLIFAQHLQRHGGSLPRAAPRRSGGRSGGNRSGGSGGAPSKPMRARPRARPGAAGAGRGRGPA